MGKETPHSFRIRTRLQIVRTFILRPSNSTARHRLLPGFATGQFISLLATLESLSTLLFYSRVPFNGSTGTVWVLSGTVHSFCVR